MKTIQYLIVCPSCRGSGEVPNPDFGITTSETMIMICPACKGAKVVIATETETETQFGTFSNQRP